jgi:hypothetical protein
VQDTLRDIPASLYKGPYMSFNIHHFSDEERTMPDGWVLHSGVELSAWGKHGRLHGSDAPGTEGSRQLITLRWRCRWTRLNLVREASEAYTNIITAIAATKSRTRKSHRRGYRWLLVRWRDVVLTSRMRTNLTPQHRSQQLLESALPPHISMPSTTSVRT